MERAISEMEKIKRAEEIYSKRNNLKLETGETPKNKSIYKILFQVLVLLNIAIIIVAVQNREYIFTSEFIEQVNKYNINIKEKIEEVFTYNENGEASTNNEEKVEKKEEAEKKANEAAQEPKQQDGALVENEEKKELSQAEQDVQNIKNNYAFILPIQGIKTSGFGDRESTNKKVTKHHTGIDLAAAKGTKIKSAIDGKVTQVSNSGDYGKHLKISKDNVTILYAHCSEIYVSEGEEIKQGQDVAAVGSTGNSTGPHLHFEIRYDDRYVDPEQILNFS